MDRIDSYRVFVRLMECQSFTKAAASLQMPRSTVSTVLKDLETRLGTELMYRTTRRVSPTADGNALYERCQMLLADFDDTEALFRQRTAQPHGRLKVNAPGRIAHRVIAPALPRFFEAYPGIELELGATDRMVALLEEGIDCAVRVGTVREAGLIVCDLGELRLSNCASPAYLEAHGRPQTLDDLDDHWAVHFISPVSGRTEEWEMLVNGEFRQFALPARVTVDNAEAYIACCLAGLGLIQVPAFDVREHIEAGRLVEVLPEYPAAPMPLSIVYPYRRHLSSSLQAFIDWSKPLFGQLAGGLESRPSGR
jgi:LysR family transcriptional regulator, regulator for bpeEF and oprC